MKKNIDNYIDEYNNKKLNNFLFNPLFRIKLTHLLAIIVLLISASFFTQSLIVMGVQIGLAIIVFFHDMDDKNLKTTLSIKIKELKEQKLTLNNTINDMNMAHHLIDEHIIYSKTDINGKITYVSSAFLKISGFTAEELIGQSHDLFQKQIIVENTYKDILKKNISKQYKCEFKHLSKTNSLYWLETLINPVYDKNNNLISYSFIQYDITAKKDFQKQHAKLMQSEKMASLGDMFGNIAHQWRQPLNTISTISSGMIMAYEYKIEQSEEKILQNLENITHQTQDLSKIIDIFKNFVKDDKEYKIYNLQDSINKSLDILKSNLSINNIKLENLMTSDELIEVLVIEGELSQVIINILNNAKDALIKNNIKNPLIKINLQRNEKYAIIIIHDNAGGINDDIISKVFEPYFTTKHQSQGTGLGLHISYKIITQSFKGQLIVNNENNGAKFTIKIPLASKE